MKQRHLSLAFIGVLLVGVVFVYGQRQPQTTSDYQEQDYDDKDVQFEATPPNLLILLADPKNGSTVPLANKANSEVVLDRSFEKVHLFCSAYYPIKWSYEGDGFPFLNVDYTRFTEDFYDPTTYAFSALLELEGLKESQSGNYSCHKWDNASLISSYHIYVPGERVFLSENNTNIYVDAAVSEIRIPCSVSDPNANVTLRKSFDKGQGEKDWMIISSAFYSYDPTSGFLFKGQAVPTALGDFICVSGSENEGNHQKLHLSVRINNSLALAGKNIKREDCCDKNYLRSLGDERTSCRAFISEQCQAPRFWDSETSPCSDWKIAEFLKSPVELCKQEIAPSNSSVAVGYFSTKENGGPRLYVFCQADPAEYTQGFKLAVEWKNGSMLFVDDDRLLVPGLSEFPSGYEIHAEITDLLNPKAPLDALVVHCYIPLKYSFKWIKIIKPIPSLELIPFVQAWYNTSITTTTTTTTTTKVPFKIQGQVPTNNFAKPGGGNVEYDPSLDSNNGITGRSSSNSWRRNNNHNNNNRDLPVSGSSRPEILTLWLSSMFFYLLYNTL